uniref:Uncharacterized protein n=1 Tax=Arundo donax TaxID=35708 RepID=A0A0A9AL60_ARUDO
MTRRLFLTGRWRSRRGSRRAPPCGGGTA